MGKKIDLKIPVNFEKIKEYKIADSRFIQCKIFLMHLGENLNGSYFSKEAVIKAIPTLANTPILGYIEDTNNGEEDFSDHRVVLERKDGDIKISYKGHAWGVIPESNNAHFEMRTCDDGEEREFLVTNGLLWTKFDDAIDIFNRDFNKQESMELDENYTGHFNKNNLYEFDEFKFYGACALGNNVSPAMRSASIDTVFTMSEIKSKLEQFKNYIQDQSSNEVDIDNKNLGKEDEILTDKIEETVVETTEEFTEVVEPIVDTVNEEVIETPEIEEVIEETVDAEITEEVIEEFSENIVIETVLKSEFDKLNAEFEEYKLNYSTLNTEVLKLQEFEAKTIKEKYDADVSEIFIKFEDKLSKMVEFENLKTKYEDMSVDLIEEKCFALLGKKNANFSVKLKEKVVKIAFESKDENEPEDQYGGILAKKYNK